MSQAAPETPPAPPAPPAPAAPAPQAPAPQATERLVPQSEVTAIAAREKEEGRRSAAAAIAAELGCTVEEAKALIAKQKAADDATKSEAQLAREAADAEKAAAAAEKLEAKREAHEARVERALAAAGFPQGDKPEDLEAAGRIRRMVTAEVGAAYEDVAADVAKLKAQFPLLFGAKPAPAGRKGPNGDPAGKPPPPSGGEDRYAAGMARAKKEADRRSGGYPALQQDK